MVNLIVLTVLMRYVAVSLQKKERNKRFKIYLLDPHGCEPNEFRCANKRCVLKTWRCDSDDDCGDGSDEANCGTNPPEAPCAFNQFACKSRNQCIPKSFHCDQENDCIDGSDEVGCSK